MGQARELKVSPGDWLLLQGNAVAVRQHFVNGERVQVREIQNGRIALTDGRTLPAGFNTFTHGYAVTSHSSQGRTVDEVLLVASSRSFGAVNREQFYVSISRGRERCQVFTDDAELLQRLIGDSHERTAAVELVKLREALAENGFSPRRDVRPVVTRQDAAKEKICRSLRPVRSTRSRLSVGQRLSKMARDFRDWTQRKTITIEPPRQHVRQSRGISSQNQGQISFFDNLSWMFRSCLRSARPSLKRRPKRLTAAPAAA